MQAFCTLSIIMLGKNIEFMWKTFLLKTWHDMAWHRIFETSFFPSMTWHDMTNTWKCLTFQETSILIGNTFSILTSNIASFMYITYYVLSNSFPIIHTVGNVRIFVLHKLKILVYIVFRHIYFDSKYLIKYKFVSMFFNYYQFFSIWSCTKTPTLLTLCITGKLEWNAFTVILKYLNNSD